MLDLWNSPRTLHGAWAEFCYAAGKIPNTPTIQKATKGKKPQRGFRR
jgi:hypothetical protein